jgi:hypothetical protein
MLCYCDRPFIVVVIVVFCTLYVWRAKTGDNYKYMMWVFHSKRRKGKTLGNSGIWWEFVGNLGGFPLEISQRLPVFPIEFPNFNRDQLPGKFPVSSYDSSPKIKFTYSSLNRTELQHAVTSLILLMYMPFF